MHEVDSYMMCATETHMMSTEDELQL